ncbi:MAG: 50S ribosomal protein L16, partial [Phycisphaerae bacterium]|nr:50S ribosomal protein L16 [Phycisphaerae bacterium]
MAMMPKRMKYRKAQRGSYRELATRGNTVAHGEFGLQSLDHGFLTARQIEAGRMAATHYLQRQGRVYIRVFPHKPISRKPVETRMGKGKGEPE